MSPTLCLLITVLLVPASGHILEPGDFIALQSVRRALRDGPGSEFFSTWDFSTDPCAFQGVVCQANRIVSLRLGDTRAGSMGLMGRLDSAVGRLHALSELSLAPGRVSGPIPATIGQLSNLRFLGLSRNLLSGVIPPTISALRQIQTVDVSFNLLSGPVPRDLTLIPTLTNLVISHNLLTGPIPNFSLSSSLLRLDLKRNNLSGSLPPLPLSLQYLSLSSNKLTGKIPSSIFSLPATHLRLERNMFRGTLEVNYDVNIPNIDLSFNRLSGEIPKGFSNVKRLFLNNNLFRGKVPRSLIEAVESQRMSALYLNHNFLSGVERDADVAAEIPSGSSLCLRGNCMEPPAGTDCPAAVAGARVRPAGLCAGVGPDQDQTEADP